jgi:hypothetical protein
MANTIKANQTVAEICLYGTSRTGAGYLCHLRTGQLFGDSELRADRSFTSAVWTALDQIVAAGVTSGQLAIFHPGGQMVTRVNIEDGLPDYGTLCGMAEPVQPVAQANDGDVFLVQMGA